MIQTWISRASVLCACLVLLGIFATPVMARTSTSQHYCESRNNVLIVRKGQAKCVTDGTSFAKANGRGSMAVAYDGGVATASGVGSYAQAGGTGTFGSIATATGVGSYSVADGGGEANASGDGSYAAAHVGYASATGANSRAQAVDPGSTAKANGTDSRSVAVSGGQAGADGVSSFAHAEGSGSQAEARGDYSHATAMGTCYIYAGAGETQSCSAP